MLIDRTMYLSIAQVLTTTAASTDVYDAVAFRDLGNGDDPTLDCLSWVAVTMAGGTSAQVQFQGSTDNSTYYTIIEGPAVVLASLTAGQRLLDVPVPRMLQAQPPGAAPLQATPRYYRFNYVIVGTMSGGSAVSSMIVLDRQTAMYYPPGIVIAN